MNFVGSKNGSGVWQAIISEMPPHKVYIELSAGKAAIYQHKLRSNTTILIDKDPSAPALGYGHRISIENRLSLAMAFYARPGCYCINGDMISFLDLYKDYFKKDTLIYADPTYLASVRSCKRKYYKYEFDTEEEHIELLNRLKALPCSIVISGYRSPLYAKELDGWRTRDIPTTNRAGKRVIETIWMNYPEPLLVHDPRYLGRNFRERERIKKKTARWMNNLSKMPRVDRISLLMSIRDLIAKNNAVSC